MKLIVQIPCYNEEDTLPQVLREIPRRIPGVDRVEILVVDDGSTDRTSDVARRAGADHVVRHAKNRGLAAAFQTGLDAALALGADVVVNTDADNQYPGSLIPALAEPILQGSADMVVADRRIGSLKHLPFLHRVLQRLGSAVVRRISGTAVPDAPSGFRALSREAAFRLEVLTDYTYTLETLIQAGRQGFRLAFLPIDINPPTRVSRLKRSQWHYVARSAGTILRLYALYRPLRTFFLMALPFLLGGLGLWGRFAYLWATDRGGRGAHVQSVVVGAALILIAVLLGALGVLGDLMARSRSVSERILAVSKKTLYGARPEREPETSATERSPALEP